MGAKRKSNLPLMIQPLPWGIWKGNLGRGTAAILTAERGTYRFRGCQELKADHDAGALWQNAAGSGGFHHVSHQK
ncbi:MAG: hypothetical protein P4L69_11275 [Desulfosporosinus sp.]|nr:hypothetical protein [Desulfosporosinus sp.]